MRTLKRIMLVAALAMAFTASAPAEGFAQHRVRGGGRTVIVAPYYSPFYSPFWYDPFFFDAQWGGVYGPYGPYYPYRRYNVDPGGEMKLEVKPKDAEVYVDGYYAGIVDDFDGVFQRLRARPGEHEITLYLDGYRTVHQRIYLQPNVTFKLRYEMERLGAGEQPEARPQPVNPPPGYGADRDPYQPPPPQTRGPVGRRPPQPPPPPRDPRDPREPREPRESSANAYGTLSIRVQPGGAEILVDGERWNGPEGQERMFIDLPEGRHTVEIHKQGFRTYVTDVDVRRGETSALNVSLRSQDEVE